MGAFEYECDRGHAVESTQRVSTCPAFSRGHACTGNLRAVGEGSQAENRRLKEYRAAHPPTDDTTTEGEHVTPTKQQPARKRQPAKPKAAAPAAVKDPDPSSAPAPPDGQLAVPIPRATTVAVEALEASLARIPDHKSKVVEGVLFLEPAEASAIDQATRDHARELMKVDRSANSYRDVLLREVRKAIVAVTGKQPDRPKAAPAKRAAAKKAAPAKKAPATKKKATPRKEVEPRFKAGAKKAS